MIITRFECASSLLCIFMNSLQKVWVEYCCIFLSLENNDKWFHNFFCEKHDELLLLPAVIAIPLYQPLFFPCVHR